MALAALSGGINGSGGKAGGIDGSGGKDASGGIVWRQSGGKAKGHGGKAGGIWQLALAAEQLAWDRGTAAVPQRISSVSVQFQFQFQFQFSFSRCHRIQGVQGAPRNAVAGFPEGF